MAVTHDNSGVGVEASELALRALALDVVGLDDFALAVLFWTGEGVCS